MIINKHVHMDYPVNMESESEVASGAGDLEDCVIDIKGEKNESQIEIESDTKNEKDGSSDSLEITAKKGISKRARISLIGLGSFAGLIGLIFLLALLLQKTLLFHPDASKLVSPDEYPILGNEITTNVAGSIVKNGWKTVDIKTADGETLHNYWIYADKTLKETPQNPATILFLHGNAGNMVRSN